MEKTGKEALTYSATAYLVAENRLLRETLARLFHKRSGISVVGQGRYSDSTVQKIAAIGCDLVLLDSLSTSESIRWAEELSVHAPQTKIILFGMDEDSACFLRAVQLGIRGYLLKDASSAEVVSAVQGIVRGESICPPKLCGLLFEFVSKELRRTSSVTDPKSYTGLGLTYRQRQLMTLVAEGLTNKEIAANLNLSEFTVRNHISRIMKQVDADTRHEAVEVIRASNFFPSNGALV